MISILGGLFIAYLAYESVTTKGLELDMHKVKPKSLKKGMIVNILNPPPYPFYLCGIVY